ncbi:MAG: outer membrane protein transport protein [Epsilonproteobacteria bacterium]|nr:outer membrane protein transport protein [Campylobacterota bacterium]
MKKIIILSTLASSLLLSSGYRLPESSLNATALSAAYVANAHGADSSYYNPANMVFNENKSCVEGTLTLIHLSEINYKDSRDEAFNSSSETENILAPTLLYSSKDYNGIRYGLSLTVPGGLTKRWQSPFAKTFAEEFTLKIIELNPSVGYKINENFAIGGGLRMIYSEGVVKSDGDGAGTIPATIKRDMEANTIEFGYNLALTYKPLTNLTLAATYRSNVDIKEEGNAELSLSGTKLYDGGASVEVPLPAVLALAVAYDFGSTVVELAYDKTYWSAYENLDFEFKDTVPRALQAAFDDPKARNWEDTDAFRLGLTHQLNDEITLMGAIATDENPAPEENIGFELPDSDAMLYSAGIKYKYSDQITLGASLLYDAKDERTVVNEDINGKFTDASATLFTIGASYSY